MDRQIDLTENRDFGHHFFRDINNVIERMVEHGKYLWTWNSLLYRDKNEVIFTGDKEERYFKKLPSWGTPRIL